LASAQPALLKINCDDGLGCEREHAA